MTGKDKTAKSGKSKKALEAEFAAAVAAADHGDSFTCSSSNTTRGGSRLTVKAPNPMYDDKGNYINPPDEKRSGAVAAPMSKKEIREAKKAAKQTGVVDRKDAAAEVKEESKGDYMDEAPAL